MEDAENIWREAAPMKKNFNIVEAKRSYGHCRSGENESFAPMLENIFHVGGI